MKRQRKVIRFDYEKLDRTDDYRFWGIHPKKGRLHIDTKRFKKICEEEGYHDLVHEGMFVNRSTPYLIPKHKNRHDYKINIFKDLINNLKEDWFQDYKPVFAKIKTPSEVQQDVRLSNLMYMSNSDDFELADEAGFMAMVKRMRKYDEIVHSLYVQFIQKVTTEIHRFVLIVCVELGYDQPDFSMTSFATFTDGLIKDKNKPKLESFKNYKTFDSLNKINNFLKHNTKRAYQKLLRNYPELVCNVNDKSSKKPYENGMYAGSWVRFPENYIDNIFGELILFFEDYCLNVLGEKKEEVEWNYDAYFKYAYKQFQNPDDYFGF